MKASIKESLIRTSKTNQATLELLRPEIEKHCKDGGKL